MRAITNSDRASDNAAVLCLLGAVFLIRFFYIGSMDLAPDEAYYWDWSRRLSFGYFDHPPMVAWFIYASTKLFGDTLRGVKFMAVFSSLLAAWCSCRLAKNYVTKTSSLLVFVIVSNTVILFGVGCFIATPDIPMILFWSMGLVFAYKAIFEKSRSAWGWLGLTMGSGLLSKYIFVLFIISLIMFLLAYKDVRPLLLSRRLFGALALAFMVFLPNLIWNSHHRWISILFQFRHGLSGAGRIHFNYLGEYVSGQLGVLSIFPFIVLIWALLSEFGAIRRESKKGYLALFCVIPFLFFALTSLKNRVEANWAAPAYISGLIWIPILWEKLQGKKTLRLCIAASAGISSIALTLIMIHAQKPFLPLPPGIDPTEQVRGWKAWAADIASMQKEIDPSMRMPLCACRYQETALLGFYAPGHPYVLSLPVGARENEYSLVQDGNSFSNGALLIVPTEHVYLPPEISSYFPRSLHVGNVYRRFNARLLDSFGVFKVQKP